MSEMQARINHSRVFSRLPQKAKTCNLLKRLFISIKYLYQTGEIKQTPVEVTQIRTKGMYMPHSWRELIFNGT